MSAQFPAPPVPWTEQYVARHRALVSALLDEDHGWFRQFDAEDVSRMLDAFSPVSVTRAYFLYRATGWQEGLARQAAAARYRDFTSDPAPVTDRAAAARAVACLAFSM